jgi:heptosyltransferase-2
MSSAAPALTPLRIVVLRYRFIGDTVLLTPFLRQLRRQHPTAVIDVVVAPDAADLLEFNPNLNTVLYLDKKGRYPATLSPENTLPKGVLRQAALLRGRCYDVAYVLKRSFSSALLAFLAGIPERRGFATEGRGFMLTHPMPYPQQVHEVEAFLSLLEPADSERYPHPPALELPLVDEAFEASLAQQVAASEAVAGQPVFRLGLHGVASNALKQWPMPQWEVLLQQHVLPWFAQQGVPLQVSAVGGAAEAAAYEGVQALASTAPSPVFVGITCGQLSVLQSTLHLGSLHAMLGVDSGPLHLAASQGVPVFALFGGTSLQRWAPWPWVFHQSAPVAHQPFALGLPCQPCHLKAPCPIGLACLNTLSPAAVWAALEPWLAQRVTAWQAILA